jgi:predicted acetyltransferase
MGYAVSKDYRGRGIATEAVNYDVKMYSILNEDA